MALDMFVFGGDGMARARAHHYVPQAYLRQWAADVGHVAVRRRGNLTAFVASTRKVAQETDLYTVETEAGPSDFVERSLSRMEGVLPDVLAAMRRGNIPKAGSPGRALFAGLLALQFIRTPDRVEHQRFPEDALAAGGGVLPVPKAVIEALLAERWGQVPHESEVQGAWDYVNVFLRSGPRLTQADYLAASFGTLPKLTDRLGSMRWSTEATKGMPFVTSDQPLSLWVKHPDGGRGVGIDGAEEIRFPVGPRNLLVLRPDGREPSGLVPRSRVLSVNAHAGATCRQMVIAEPNRTGLLEDLQLRDTRPMWKFNEGPLYESGPNGLEYQGEVIQSYRPYDDRVASEYAAGPYSSRPGSRQ